MPTLTVTAKGQVTLRKELLQHLGVGPGDKLELDFQPRGQVLLRAPRKTKTIDDLFGILAGKSDRVLTIEQINEYAAKGWAGQLDYND